MMNITAIVYLMLLYILNLNGFYSISRLKSNHRGIQFPATNLCTYLQTNSNFFDDVILSSWGCFRSAKLELANKPSFIVITGKSGTGKSVLISAFEHLIKKGRDSKSKSREIFSIFDGASDDPTIEASYNNDSFRRVYSIKTKKTTCEIMNKKVPVKSFVEYLPIRFWYRNSMSVLSDENGSILTQIDDILQLTKGLDSDISFAYEQWSESYRTVTRLKYLKQTLQLTGKKQEISMLRDRVETADGLEMKLLDVFQDCVVAFETIAGPAPVEFQNDIDYIANPVGGPSDITTVISSLHQVLSANQILSTNVQKTWRCLQQAQKTTEDLADAFAATFQSSSLPTKSQAVGIPLRGKPMTMSTAASQAHLSHAAISDIDRLFNEVTLCLSCLDSFDRTLTRYNISFEGQTGEPLVSARNDLLQCKAMLLRSHSSLNSFKADWPDLQAVNVQLRTLKAQWESLAYEHGCLPAEIGKEISQWRRDLDSFENIDVLLPEAVTEEIRLRKKYAALAAHYTVIRSKVASDIVEYVNNLLPALEMNSKRVSVHHQFVGVPEALQAALSNLELVNSDQLCEALVNHIVPDAENHLAAGWDEYRLQVESSSDIGVVVKGTIRAPTKAPLQRLGIDTLSSGELSRLALALETCCLERTGSYVNATINFNASIEIRHAHKNQLSDTESCGSNKKNDDEIIYGLDSNRTHTAELVVFDELDAHVGGEAAAAVARLLKKQGCSRQVIAVTHNPIIAAAADRHFLVRRCNDNRDAFIQVDLPNNPNREIIDGESVVEELFGSRREMEIARMLSGDSDDTHGRALAQALLLAVGSQPSAVTHAVDLTIV